MPRCEYQLSGTGYNQYSNLRCNPFQLPLREIVARDICRCTEDECSNYSLRYVFQNVCQCNMDTLRQLLPSYRGYNNICCRPHICPNSERQKDNEIDSKRLQLFQDSLGMMAKKARHIYASDPFGINGFLNQRRICKPSAFKPVKLVNDGRPSIETKYLFRKQLMDLANRKFDENKDLISLTDSHSQHERKQNLEDASAVTVDPWNKHSIMSSIINKDNDENANLLENVDRLTGDEFTSNFFFSSKAIIENSTVESEEIPEDVQDGANEQLLEDLTAMTDELNQISEGEQVNDDNYERRWEEDMAYITPEMQSIKTIFSNEFTLPDDGGETLELITEERTGVRTESAVMTTDFSDHEETKAIASEAPGIMQAELNDHEESITDVTPGLKEQGFNDHEKEKALSDVDPDEMKTAFNDSDQEKALIDMTTDEMKMNFSDLEEQAFTDVVPGDNDYEDHMLGEFYLNEENTEQKDEKINGSKDDSREEDLTDDTTEEINQ